MSKETKSSALPPPGPIFIIQNTKPINHLLFSSKNENILYVGNRDGDLILYDLKSRRPLFNSNVNKQPILSIDELNEDNLLTYHRNGSVFKWTRTETGNWKSNCVYEKEVYTFCPFVVSQDKKILYLPSKESSVIDCVEMNSYKKINSLKSNTNENMTERGMLMRILQIDTNSLLAGYENGELVLFDLNEFKEMANINLFNGQPIMCMDYSKKANFGSAGSAELIVNQFSINETTSDGKQKEEFKKLNPIKLVNPGLNCIQIRKTDSKLFACGGWDYRVRLYSVKKQNLLAVLDFHKEAINTIDFSASNLMSVGSNDGYISFWNLYS